MGGMKHITTLEDQEQNRSESSDTDKEDFEDSKDEMTGPEPAEPGRDHMSLSQGFPPSFQWSSQLSVLADNLIGMVLVMYVVVKAVT
ncbi:hypothetical protein EVAR_102901_1 [Eumeta japonica]|uniref:Uncharacterized protein n=1 Tax=Eumeta variegata TaxID=151549 RepID=A0A4C1ZMA2_EUMVA|nr:hypothetical protein EVAR_102901_1 [Eumeta japonica]